MDEVDIDDGLASWCEGKPTSGRYDRTSWEVSEDIRSDSRVRTGDCEESWSFAENEDMSL